MKTELKRRLSALETELGQTKEKAALDLKARDGTISSRDVEIEELKKLVASLQKELYDAKEADRKSSGVIAGLEEELRRLRERVAQLESRQTSCHKDSIRPQAGQEGRIHTALQWPYDTPHKCSLESGG